MDAAHMCRYIANLMAALQNKMLVLESAKPGVAGETEVAPVAALEQDAAI